MSETIKDGGPAFPHDKYTKREDGQWGVFASGGMSLRDWFAGQALPAVIRQCNPLEKEFGETMPGMFARRSYEAADAMLAARGATK